MDINSFVLIRLTRDISCRTADILTDHDTVFFNQDNLSPFPTFGPRMTGVHPIQHENVLIPQDYDR